MRKTLFLLLIILLLGAAWIGGWYFVAGQVEKQLAKAKTRMADSGRILECVEQRIGGFPFRISVRCDRFAYTDEVRGFSVIGGEVKSAAQLYQPTKAIIEFASPLKFTDRLLQTYDITWQSMRGSVNVSLDGLEKFSLVSTGLDVTPGDRRINPINFSKLQLHGRKIGENNLDLAIRTDSVASGVDVWPNFDLDATFSLKDAYRQLLRDPDLKKLAQQKGLSGELRRLDYASADGGSINLSGPFELTTNGVLSGAFEIEARELQSILDTLAIAFPQNRQQFEQFRTAVRLIGGKEGNVKLKVNVADGNASIGFIPIGAIPPLF